MEYAGRTAFVTGGAQGIGLGIARRLAREGVKLALADIDAPALENARAELANTTAVATYVLDVRDRDAFATVAEQVTAQLGPVSLLFNNAGVAGGTPVTKMTYEMWDWVLGINLYGVVNGIQTFLPAMIERGEGGHVVNTSSGAGMAATSGLLYCTSKFAVVGLSERLRLELEEAETGIGVSVLCPGPVATGILSHTVATSPETASAATLKRAEDLTNLLALGVSPDEVGDMVWRAVIDNSPYIFTDRIVADAVAERTEAILAAMPAGNNYADQATIKQAATKLGIMGRSKDLE